MYQFRNEALQQQFNRFVFKLEQQEYQKEGIDWSFIAFPDDQDVLDLMEKRHDGILSVLDSTFANRLWLPSNSQISAMNTMAYRRRPAIP